MNITVPKEAVDIINELHAVLFKAYLVGGCVRDMQLGRMPKDWDIVTDARPEQILELFPNSKMVGEKFGVALVNGIEVATFRAEGAYEDGRHPEQVVFVTDPEQDANRRDFTVNALYYDPMNGQLLDFHHGLEDLRDRTIRAIGSPWDRFQEDFLRMMRAVRFSAGLGFSLEASTLRAITCNASNILDIAQERIRMELSRMLTQGNADTAIRQLNIVGLLEWVLNPVYKMQGVTQPVQYHPEGDVYRHTCLALSHLQPGCNLTLALAVLLHDMGKPVTATADELGNPRFHGHDEVGARMTRVFLSGRLKYSNDIVDRVEWLVANHMRVYEVDRMRLSKLRRLIAEPGWEELVALAECDCFGSCQDVSINPVLAMIAGRKDLEAAQHKQTLPNCFINGDDLIAMGMKPGPTFKVILSTVLDAQLEGVVTTREQALDYAATFPETYA